MTTEIDREIEQVRAHVVAAMGELSKHYRLKVECEVTRHHDEPTSHSWYVFFHANDAPPKCKFCGGNGDIAMLHAATPEQLMECADKRFAGVAP